MQDKIYQIPELTEEQQKIFLEGYQNELGFNDNEWEDYAIDDWDKVHDFLLLEGDKKEKMESNYLITNYVFMYRGYKFFTTSSQYRKDGGLCPPEFDEVVYCEEPIPRNIEKELEAIDKKIKALLKKKEKLVQHHMSSATTFEEKFKAWLENSEKEHLNDIPDRNRYPLIRSWIDDRDFHRYETVYILEYMEDDFALIYDEEFRKECFSDKYTDEKRYAKICALAKECMDNNIESFKLDW